MKKRKLSTGLALLCIILAVLAGCSASGGNQDKGGSLPQVGERLSGFTVSELGTIGELGAGTALFTHEKSGAQLLYIKNDDRELGFSISYKTPLVDETDTNHIFEHAILASSDKYPSSDLFFDLANKSYNTFINAMTYPVITMYPLCSQSEDQLLKLADAYLSCMVAPGVMEDENIFKREALRYEMEDKDSPITMAGTVLSEDMGYSGDIDRNAMSATLKALYPDMAASNMVGRLFENYKDLTYENMKATYNRCYHFDNSLMVLYGNLDYKKFLEFIDQEYLSKAERNHTDLSAYTDEEVPKGYVQVRAESPAYEGSAAKQASVIQYAIDLSGDSWEDILKWLVYTDMLNEDNSPLQQYAREEGIPGRITAMVQMGTMKPYLLFELSNTDEDKKEAFQTAISRALKEVADNGISQDVYDTVLKQYELSRYITRDGTSVSVDAAANIGIYWFYTGKTDFYPEMERCLSLIEADHGQKLLKDLAGNAQKPVRSACVATVPVPGLAEKMDQERKDYLEDMKASMTPGEIDRMVEDTKAFRTWNEAGTSNGSFMIDAGNLPEPAMDSHFRKNEKDGLIIYSAPVDASKAGFSQIYFNLGGIPEEDLYYLPIYQMLIGRMDTHTHTPEELSSLMGVYLYGMGSQERYVDQQPGRPLSVVSWYGMTEDYETGLKLLLEIMGQTEFSDTKQAIQVMEQYVPLYDQSRASDKMGLAKEEATAYISKSQAFSGSVNSQEQYRFMKEVLRRLKEEKGYPQEFQGKMEEISNYLLNRNGLAAMNAASPQALGTMERQAGEILGSLPYTPLQPQDYGKMLARKQKRAICVESPDQYIVFAGDMNQVEGKDLAFLMAAKDGYIVPRLRFQMGAYSAGASFSPFDQWIYMYTYSDPNISGTMDVAEGLGDYLEKAEISREDLKGYILNAYAAANPPQGIFGEQARAVWLDISGRDTEAIQKMAGEIRDTTMKDKEEAAGRLEEAFRRGSVVVVGNQGNIEKDKGRFDEVLDYK